VIKIGTRASQLAVVQAQKVADLIAKMVPGLPVEIVKISTYGDRNQKDSLSQIGGKSVFVKEIQEALLTNAIDIAVHSMKDLTSAPPSGLQLAGFLKPESISDVLVSKKGHTLEQLPQSATIATGSMRRRALIKHLRPDIQFVDIRGNVDTRLKKLHSESIDATILSEAGLIRLKLTDVISDTFPPHCFLPAPGQGVIALEIRSKDTKSQKICAQISDHIQSQISKIEYELLKGLEFNCTIPLGVFTHLEGNQVNIKIGIEIEGKWKEWEARYTQETIDKNLQSLIQEIKASYER
jgi:hydroxymethylbilane synthase